MREESKALEFMCVYRWFGHRKECLPILIDGVDGSDDFFHFSGIAEE